MVKGGEGYNEEKYLRSGKMDFMQDRNLFLAFQERWTIDKIRAMTLNDYTSTKALSNDNRDDFTFWIENKLDKIGSIWGGSSFKFGIYRQNNSETKENSGKYRYDNNYGWLSKYGDTAEKAFLVIKNMIIEIITASQENNLEAIDKIDLGDAFKWKIAFHYQNVNDIKIVDIFQSNTLKRINRNKLENTNFIISRIHRQLLDDKIYTLETMRDEKAIPLWDIYGENMLELFKIYLEEKFKNKNTQSSYLSNMKTLVKRYSLKLEECKFPNTFLETKTKLEENPDFISFNQTNNTAYSNALKHYYDFLLDYSNKNIEQDEDEELSDLHEIENKNKATIKQTTLNQILYGPPGTGKTYHTIDRALEILGIDCKDKTREERKELFEAYKQKGQIEFVTFHQNYGYEEFVEGIKPKLDENGGENKSLEYKIEEGIFKIICERARQNTKDFLEKIHQNYNSDEPIDFKRDLWRLYTLPNGDIEDDYFKDCIDKNYIYANKNFGKEKLISPDVQKGDYIIIPSAIPGKRSKSIRAFGVFGDVIKEKIDEEKGYRSVEWYWFTENQDEELFFENVNFAQQTFSKVKKSKNVILDYFNTKSENIIDDISKPHILIIDEINRGNISKIFGELITLIEPSKRIGAKEELRVTLPYSQTSFGVPNNLYIIGTMNTADRSITSLDTAIRRRFEFVEMMPDATKLEDKVIEGINLQKMLTVINERIEFLYDREKTIGHTYLLDIKNLDDLKEAFQNKIIPLLQEYFYRNYALIQAALNDNGMIKEIEDSKKASIINCKGFKKLENIDFESKTIYSISDDENLWDDPQTYINIYEG